MGLGARSRDTPAQKLVDRVLADGHSGIPHAHDFAQAYHNFHGDWITSFQHALSLNTPYNEKVAAEFMAILLKD